MIDPTNRNTALATALVEELARSGMRRAVLSPGSRSTPIALALDREQAIELDVVLDERSAGFRALGSALASGRPVAVACTSGSAAANLHPAVVEADQAGVPLLLLTSDRPPELRGIGAGQAIDQIKLYGDAVRWFCEVGTHEADDAGLLHYRSLGCRAYSEALGGRGPVHLNLAWRDPLGPEESPGDLTAADPLAVRGRGDRPLTTEVRSQAATAELVTALGEAISRAERPLIVAGRRPWGGLAEPLTELARRARMPILAEPTSQLRLGPHDRSGVIAAYDLIARSQPGALAPDLVLRVGDMPTSKPLRAWLAAGGADQIVVDPQGRWDEPTRRAGAIVRTDPGPLLAALAATDPANDESWLERWLGAERKAQGAIDEILDAVEAATEPGLVRGLGPRLGDGDALLVASSMPVRDAEAFLAAEQADVRCFANRGANGIDGLIATAAGIAGESAGRTWAVLGDLAVAHDLGSLSLLGEAGSDVRLLVLDNEGGRIFEFLPQAGQVDRQRFERLFITPSGLDLEAAAGLFELQYRRIESVEDLDDLDAGPTLLHVRIDPRSNVELHDRITESVSAAIGGG